MIMHEYRKILGTFDPGLSFVGSLAYTDRPVYHVRRESKSYVLKVGSRRDPLRRRAIQRESRVLAASWEIPGIAHLEKDYGCRGPYIALLRDYADGKDILRYGMEKLDSSFWRDVEYTIRSLHHAGLANMDIEGRNIVVSPNGKGGTIVDLGTCVFKSEVPMTRFEELMHTDLDNLAILAQ